MKIQIRAVALTAAMVPHLAVAANKTWDGGGADANWLTAANWDANTLPIAGDSLFFAGGTKTSNTNNFAANTAFNGITFNSGASGFTLNGNAINLAGNIANSSASTQNVNLALALQQDVVASTASTGSLTLNGQLFGTHKLTLSSAGATTITLSSTASQNTFAGTVQANTATSFVASNNVNLSAATVSLLGTANLDSRGTLTIGGLNGDATSTVKRNSTGAGNTLVVAGTGAYTFAGEIGNGTGTGAGLIVRMSYGAQRGGSQTLGGTNTFTGSTTVDAGKLVLDYATSNTNKLADGAALTFRAGTIELAGGSHTEVVQSTAISGSTTNAGMVNITRTSGSSVLQMGAIGVGDFSSSSGAINFSAAGIATTTTGTTVAGLLGGANMAARFTIGGTDWATKAVSPSNDIVAYTGYLPFVTTGGVAAGNYALTGGSTLTGNVAINTLKITSSTGSDQTLALGTRTLSMGRSGLLLTGTDNYAITTAGGALGGVILHNYSTGTLTLGATSGVIEHAGTGKTILTTASTATTANTANGFWLDSGTLQFSNNNQLPGNGNMVLYSGRLVADTAAGNIALTNTSAGGFRTVVLGSDVPVIDVIGGGTLTIGGVIGTVFANPNPFISPVVFGSSLSNGTIAVTGVNTYSGDTRIAGGRVSINSATSFGSTAGNYKLVFSGNSTLNTTADLTMSRLTEINAGVTATIEPNAAVTLTHNGNIAGSGHLAKAGLGTLLLSGPQTYTGNTTIAAGTLKLDSTGTIANSPIINLGTLASQGTLDVTAKSAFGFSSAQTVTGYGLINIGAGKTVTVAGPLQPGNSAGVTSVTGNLELLSSTTTTLELAGSAGVAGTDFDKVIASGAMTYAGDLYFVSFGGFNLNQGGSYDVFDFDSVSGNFTNVYFAGYELTYADGEWSGVAGGTSVTFTPGTGVLITVVPEPSTALLLAAGTALLGQRRRRRVA